MEKAGRRTLFLTGMIGMFFCTIFMFSEIFPVTWKEGCDVDVEVRAKHSTITNV